MNGAGKTTLVRILATQLEPTSGSATIDGLDVMKDAGRLRERIASIPQEARTVAWMTPPQTVYSYLRWRGIRHGDAKRKAREALEQVGAGPYSDRLNRKLSGGQKRKVLVATVLAADAEISFLDEPTTGLDPISRRELWESLETISKDRLLILTTHYLAEGEQLADMIGILDKGRLVGMGTLDELRGLVKHQYSGRLQAGSVVPRVADGDVTTARDGQTQILTSEEEAYRLSRSLLEAGTRFSVNRITLDDVFFRLIHSSPEGVRSP